MSNYTNQEKHGIRDVGIGGGRHFALRFPVQDNDKLKCVAWISQSDCLCSTRQGRGSELWPVGQFCPDFIVVRTGLDLHIWRERSVLSVILSGFHSCPNRIGPGQVTSEIWSVGQLGVLDKVGGQRDGGLRGIWPSGSCGDPGDVGNQTGVARDGTTRSV